MPNFLKNDLKALKMSKIPKKPKTLNLALFLVFGILIAAIVLYANSSNFTKSSANPLDSSSTELTPISFETLAQGDGVSMSGEFANDQNQTIHFYIFANQQSWQEFWNRIYPLADPRPPLPEADFEQENILFVATSRRPSAGYSLEIQKLVVTDQKLTATVLETQPEEKCASITVLTRPFHAVKFQKIAIEEAGYNLQVVQQSC